MVRARRLGVESTLHRSQKAAVAGQPGYSSRLTACALVDTPMASSATCPWHSLAPADVACALATDMALGLTGGRGCRPPRAHRHKRACQLASGAVVEPAGPPVH